MTDTTDSFELALERLHERQMEFLKNASPDDWHRYALELNWDDRLDGLFWIVSQPDCDRATALLVFWKGYPTGYDYEDEEEAMGDSNYSVAPMLRYIAERFNTTGYPRAELAYDFQGDHGLGYVKHDPVAEAGRQRDIDELIERQRDVTDPRVKLHPDLTLLRVPGRKVGRYGDTSDFYAQFPQDLDHDDSEASDAVATSRRDDDTTPASETSSRIRALRRQDSESTAESPSPWRADRSDTPSRKSVESEPAAGLSDALLDAFGLHAAMAALGFAVGFAPKYVTTHRASTLFWVAAIAGIIYCFYAAFSNFRKMQRGVAAARLAIVPSWITATTTIGLLCGIAVGWVYLMLLNDPAVTPVTRYGFVIAAGIGLIAFSFGLARFLFLPRALRDA